MHSESCEKVVLWSLFTGNFVSQDTRKSFLDAATVHPTVLENYLKLPYRVNKFQFWMRVNWHVKTWCWKPSEDSQTPRFGETGEKHAQSQGESYVFYLLPWPSSNFSSLCAGESRASQDEAGVYFLCLFTYHLSKYLLISYCVPGIVLGAEDSAVTKYIKLHRTLCSLLYP